MELLKFLKSKVFAKQLLYALIFAIVFIWLIFFALKIYTHHGEAILVPDFTGLNKKESVNLAEDRDIQVEVADSLYVDGRPRGTVIDQNPPPDFKVKENRTIFLTINAYTKAKVAVPNVVGVSFRQASVSLTSVGLKVGKLIYRPDPMKNYVIEQQINGKELKKGTMVVKGSAIDLILGKGYGNQYAKVPNLVGLTSKQAYKEVNDKYFNVGGVVYDKSIITYRDSIDAKVYTQKPNKGRNIKIGSYVDIWLTVDEDKLQSDTTNE